MSVIVKDNTEDVLSELNRKIEAALEAVGNQAVTHAKQNLTKEGLRDHGGAGLVGSITHKVVMAEKAVYVGTNNDHALWHEVGTGRYASDGNGRKGWWVYVPGGGKKGTNSGKVYSFEEAKKIMAILQSKGIDAHMTEGVKAKHYLRKAATEHGSEYKAIIESQLKK